MKDLEQPVSISFSSSTLTEGDEEEDGGKVEEEEGSEALEEEDSELSSPSSPFILSDPALSASNLFSSMAP